MTTLIAFVVALGLLIAVHEYGHYRMALACGVKVLRFSIGFGKPVLSWRRPGSSTEFTIGLLPLGGFVRMLDEREGPVPTADRHMAFNNQPLRSRALIVAAGPVANLLLAVLLYALVNWMGVQEPKPVLSSPSVGSLAEQAGLRGGEWVSQVASAGEDPQAVASFEDLRWKLTQAALAGQDLTLWISREEASIGQPVVLPLNGLDVREADAQLFNRIGIVFPWSSPQLGEVMNDSAAQAAGLMAGDLVLRVDGQAIVDAQQLRTIIRSAASADGRVTPQQWTLLRDGQQVQATVQPAIEQIAGAPVARIGAYIGTQPDMVLVRHSWLDGATRAVVRTWEVSWLTLKMMGRMLIGEASIKNLSGPLTIADYAGKSASIGVTSYLLFLALISVSLGVLNLLPLPVLDGGHLMYYLWEAVTGRSVSDAWMERLQRGGAAILMALMAVALFNDLARFAS